MLDPVKYNSSSRQRFMAAGDSEQKLILFDLLESIKEKLDADTPGDRQMELWYQTMLRQILLEVSNRILGLTHENIYIDNT